MPGGVLTGNLIAYRIPNKAALRAALLGMLLKISDKSKSGLKVNSFKPLSSKITLTPLFTTLFLLDLPMLT
jgi:hypothetical protein